MARGRALRIVLLAALALAAAGFVALGEWQVQRLHWKRALVARVDSRVHAPARPPPPPASWAGVSAARDEYRHVVLHGRYLPGRGTRVQALTELGAGDWMLDPLLTADGPVLVNRGFVPDGARPAPPPAGTVAVTGLLRISEPGGGFLRDNQPARDRWYSRDVAAIARARGLAGAAPYFVDAEAAPGDPRWPRAGLTVVRFRNHHLQYALTWFGLAVLTLWAGWRLLSEGRRMRHHGRDADSPPHRDRRA
ncbi:MAG TPA: SURF1 family protein [Thermomonas sp.]|nr:SURF1 family protein [Thermomonas sp.]